MSGPHSHVSSIVLLLQGKVWSSTDQPDGSVPNGETPTTGETVIPDEP